MVDVATLTGAVSRAFAHLITGGFANPSSFWGDVVSAADRAGERYWQIPFVDEYRTEMDSWYGDLQNSGVPEGSLVKSGMFLREFATVPWAHLDIGGTGYFRKATAWAPRGATRVTHATLVERAMGGARNGGYPLFQGVGVEGSAPVTPLVPLSGVAAVIGLVLGVLADRLATRWPEHEPPDFPAGRPRGARAVVVG